MLATLTNSQFQSIGGEPEHEIRSAHYKGLGLSVLFPLNVAQFQNFFDVSSA